MSNKEIQLTEIYGKDSMSSSRIVINDNFRLIEGYLNSFIDIIDPIEGTINVNNIVANGAFSITLNTTSSDSSIQNSTITAFSINEDGVVSIPNMFVDSNTLNSIQLIKPNVSGYTSLTTNDNGELLVNGQPIVSKEEETKENLIIKDPTILSETFSSKRLLSDDIAYKYNTIVLDKVLDVRVKDPNIMSLKDDQTSIKQYFVTKNKNKETIQIINDTQSYFLLNIQHCNNRNFKIYTSDNSVSVVEPDGKINILLPEKSSYLFDMSFVDNILYMHIDIQKQCNN